MKRRTMKNNRPALYLCAAAVFAFFCGGFLFPAGKTALEYYDSGIQKQSSLDWYGASEQFHEAVRANSSFGEAWFHLAQCSYQLGDFSLCLTYLDTADKFLKSRNDILDLRGMALIALGRLDEARKIFDSVIKNFPNDIDARFGLAELNLFSGSLSGAEAAYKDTLKRQRDNRKALLSLALVSAAVGKNDTARDYINQALQSHSEEAEVHYLAAWLYAQSGDLRQAEARARAAVQINSTYNDAYQLLASILFAEKKYSEASDICDYLISVDRNLNSAWYLKGLSEYKLGNSSDAVTTWTTGLSVNPHDEIMRSALELLIQDTVSLEDTRRPQWAQYHINKAREYAKRFESDRTRYEYQRALTIDPLNEEARKSFAEMLNRDGYNEAYLEQLKFIKNTTASNVAASETEKNTDKTETSDAVQLSDTIDAYNSLLRNNLAAEWSVKPFYLDKIRWKLGIYYTAVPIQILHPEVSEITAQTVASLFKGAAVTSVDVGTSAVNGFSDAYSEARKQNCDYFIMISVDDAGREFSLDAVMYSARTGNEVKKISVFRTGNDRYALSLQTFREKILEILPVKGKILARDGSEILVDLGLSEGMKKDSQLAVIRKGTVTTADSGPGLLYNKDSVLGKIKITSVGEEISQGTLSDSGFFDKVNIGDEVIVLSIPSDKTDKDSSVASDTAPAANAQGKPAVSKKNESSDNNAENKKLTPASLGIEHSSTLIDMIRKIY